MAAGSDPRRWWALTALALSMLTLGFDTTILNVALPTMAEELGASTGEQQWMADAYIVVFAAAMLPAGLLGDRFGRRALLLLGLGVFLVASTAGALAHSPVPVIVARTAMGVGAALIMPLATSVVPSLFDGEERSRAVGAISAASALGMPLGPIIGGWLLNHFWWGSVFLVNVPMAALAIVACLFLLPETLDPAAPKVDVSSAVLTAGGLGALVFALIEGPERGWADPVLLLMFSFAAALLTGLVLRSRHLPQPMLDLSLLRERSFLWNAVAATLMTLVLNGLLFMLPQYLQAVRGNNALETGVRTLPMMVGVILASRGSGALSQRFGPRPVIAGGLVVFAGATFLGSTTGTSDGYGLTATWLVILGFGFGFSLVPAMTAALSALPRERAGSGSGLLLTLRQTGGAIGVALLGSLLANTYASRLDTAELPGPAADRAQESVVAAHMVADELGTPGLVHSANAAFLRGMDVALLVCGCAALLVGLLVQLVLPNPRPDAPETAAPPEGAHSPYPEAEVTDADLSPSPPTGDVVRESPDARQ